MDYEDKVIKGICGHEFTFEAGEQKFYEDKGFTPPKRCPECRAKKKQEREQKENNQ